MVYPKELQEYIDNELTKESKPRFAETIENRYGKITKRLWSIRFRAKDKHPYVKEVFRENENRKWMNTDFYFTQLGGWHTIWETKCIGYGGYVEPQNKLVDYDYKTPIIEAKRLYTYQDIRKLDSTLKYFYTDGSQPDIINYIKRWRKYPMLELLAKCGYEYLYTDTRVLTLKGAKKKQVINYMKKNERYMHESHPKYNEIIHCATKNISPEQYRQDFTVNKLMKEYSQLNYSVQEWIDIYKYVNKQKDNFHTFVDYIEMQQEINSNIHDRGVMFPRNLTKAHEDMVDMKIVRENKENDTHLSAISKVLKPLQVAQKDMQIIIPKSQKEIIDLGNALHNCVGRCGYGKRMADGEIIILAVYKNGKPLECCELSKKEKSLSITQLRGDHNLDSEYHNDAEKLVNKFIRLYSRNNMACALTA